MLRFNVSNVLFNRRVYNCVMCSHVLNDPVQLNHCGHRVCLSCYRRFEASNECPVCFLDLIIPPFYRDMKLKSEIDNLMVHCPGCNDEVLMADFWGNHAAACPAFQGDFQQVNCPHCNDLMFRHQLKAHVDLNCTSTDFAYPISVDTIIPHENYAARYQCGGCNMTLSTLCQCRNGHRFCLDCYAGFKCPLCQSVGFQDHAIWVDVDSSTFKCSNEGCEWEGKCYQIEDHEKECSFKEKFCNICGIDHIGDHHIVPVFKCPKCAYWFPTEVQQEHVDVCISRLIQCQLCDGKFHLVDEPHNDNVVRCLNCDTFMKFDVALDHEAECPGK